MAIIIGSARIDEHGNATGGAPGDQSGKEVANQEFYVAKKGWYILRPKSNTDAEKIGSIMYNACKNSNIGYSQSDRYGVVKYGTQSKIKTNADCSSLVRQVVKEATGKDPGDFNTANEASVLERTGLFYTRKSYESGTILYTGDVLVTKTQGHTVVVTQGNPRSKTVNVVSTTPKVDTTPTTTSKPAPAVSFNPLYSKSFTTTANLNLRLSAPRGKIILVMPKGSKVRCYGYHTGDMLLVVYNKSVGYASLKYLK